MNKQENLSLQLAFTGEKKRDASASIRGFVYQNLLAIEELIKEDTDRVFCEYIEDITSVDKYGNCRIIQAKYYPSTLSSNMEKEVFREMYCQYLKLIDEGGLKSVIPILNVFSVGNKDISLKVTRKIILSYDIESDGTIVIPDTEAVEIPFYMIPTSDFLLNEENIKTLKKCMPKEDLKILFQENKKGRGINSTFEKEYYDKIEEWLKDVYQERESN